MLRRHLVTLSLVASALSACSQPAPTAVYDATLYRDTSAAIDVIATRDSADAARTCRARSDCAGNAAGLECDTATGRCVACLPSADTCPASQHCDDASHTCVAGCRGDDGCAGAVLDAGADASGDASVAAMRCDTRSHTCVACVTDAHCPPGNYCRGSRCASGCDATHGCATGETCCDGACVDTRSNTASCGACGALCAATPQATAQCSSGACRVTCNAGFSDCDGDASNGCETATSVDPNNCGACGNICPTMTGTTATCSAGACGGACSFGFGDCDRDRTNGCERALFDEQNCGACGNVCPTGLICNGTTCQAAVCCAELHTRLPSLPTGAYPLAGESGDYQAYCDMTTEGGGWTLTLMLPDTAGATYNYPAEGWTDVSLSNAEVTDPTRNLLVRSQGFWRVPVLAEMRLCLGSYTNCISEPRSAPSTQSMFLSDETPSMRAAADFSIWGYSATTGCSRAGFNVLAPGGTARCRYGIVFDPLGACGGADDQSIGLGCTGYRGAQVSAGRADSTGAFRSQRAWILVR